MVGSAPVNGAGIVRWLVPHRRRNGCSLDGTVEVALTTERQGRSPTWLAIAIFLVAANLRPAVASVGPVLTDIRHSLHLSSPGLAILTSLPVVCFGALAPLGPWLSRRIGLVRAIGCYATLILIGLLVRIGPDAGTLFAGTLVIAAGIAAANVLIPALIKQEFPDRTGHMMGLYTLALTGSAALAAGLTVPLQQALGGGWRDGLGGWAVLAAIALVVWVPQLGVDPEAKVGRVFLRGLLRDRVAWMVTLYFGLQSLSFYAVLTWLPTIFEDHAASAGHAGALLSLSTAVQAPIALTVPALAIRLRSPAILVVGSATFTGLGLVALLAFPMAAPYLWVILLGIGQGAAFPVGLTLVVLRSRTPAVTQQLSSMSQGLGYLIAALGPLFTGMFHAMTGTWTLSFAILLALLVPQAVFGVAASKRRYAGG
jgi:MFS transporter, CP family, cyanate transporter